MTDGADVAITLIDSLKSKQCDYTLLFWLQLPHILKLQTHFRDDMEEFLAQHKMCISDFVFNGKNTEFLQRFFKALKGCFLHTGIKAVAPRNYLVEYGQGGKDRLKAKYADVTWPRPRLCFSLQSMGPGGGFFMLFQSWQDGLIAQREILMTSTYVFNHRIFNVHQFLEHQFGEEARPVRLLIDWEIMQSAYQGRITREEIIQISDNFPTWLVNEMRQKSMIHSTSKVRCIVKEKSRAKGDDYKISRHFIFNIASVSLEGHSIILQHILEKYRSDIVSLRQNKNLAHIQEDNLRLPIWGMDFGIIRGQNGIATMFGIKQGEDQAAQKASITYILTITETCTKTKKHKLFAQSNIMELSEDDALALLYHTSYTIPWCADIITYERLAIQDLKVLSIY
jgi:hypothetical protein